MEQKITSARRNDPAFDGWLRTMHGPAHARRTAERNAGFFLPHLRSGMTLLDAGCGPGSITVGLAAAVASASAEASSVADGSGQAAEGGEESGQQVPLQPGEVVGIDSAADAIASARAFAEARHCTNVRYEQADVYALPYADATFDAGFMHAILQHLADPLAALVEMRRVLKPGGIIGLADADFDGSIITPMTPELAQGIEMMGRMRQNPLIGKHLRELLAEAGFSRSEGSVIGNAEGTSDATARTGEFWARYYEAPELIAHIGRRGWYSEEEIRVMGAAWRAWGQSPGAFWATFHCQAIGWA